MRRIAAAALGVALLVGVGAGAAQAAPGDTVTRKWTAPAGKTKILKAVRPYGVYTREGDVVWTRGYLKDLKRDGWSPGVQFRAWDKGKWKQSDVYFRVKPNGKPYDQKFTMHYGLFWATSAKHLQVRKVALKATNSKSRKYGAWKKLF
ncbi:hypothetical protein LO762_19270 [Actinocorallia sp. API 0066]|uniref:hypothetical protein n=1 Tax=Actinocorallia sp. API 0066 TaxID=2896846 RepID=UPI001E48C166|nr:hypothetical protein [Actinocorallia sp. API 0066]MCD0451322.1 hypothetical protein [Actinocorallia sp. API 0066]